MVADLDLAASALDNASAAYRSLRATAAAGRA
jgi:hypothetical protein